MIYSAPDEGIFKGILLTNLKNSIPKALTWGKRKGNRRFLLDSDIVSLFDMKLFIMENSEASVLRLSGT